MAGQAEKQKEKELQKVEAKQKKSSRVQAAMAQFAVLARQIQEVKGVKVLAAQVDAETPQELREIADAYKQKLGSGIVVLGAPIENKAALVVMVTPDLTAKHSAGQLMKQLAPMVGGTGGGRPDMAQGGGPNLSELPTVYKNIVTII